MLAHRLDHQSEHVDLALGVMRGERQDVAAGVVEDAVNAHRLTFALDHDRRAMTHVGMPEGAGSLGLPAQAHLAADTLTAAQRNAIEAELLVEAAHATGRDGACFEPAFGD